MVVDVFTTGGLSDPKTVFGLLEFNTVGGVTDLPVTQINVNSTQVKRYTDNEY